MTSSRHFLITLLASATAAIASVGCGASQAALRAPIEPYPILDNDAVGSLGAGCTIAGTLHVLATKVAPYAGVRAQADASRIILRFLHQRGSSALALAVDPQSLDAVDAAEPWDPMLADERNLGESATGQATPVLWRDSAHEDIGAERPEPSRLDAEAPVMAPIDSERWLSVSKVGSIYAGMDIRVRVVNEHGVPLGAPVTLASDGRAFGAPTVAVDPSGRGVVAFLQSGDHGFALVAASLDCHVPARRHLQAAWALQTAP
jgi:hypothetical protein